MIRNLSIVAALCALLVAVPASAQERSAWPERLFVTIDVPFQPLNNDFSEVVSITDAIAKSEKDSFNASYPTTRGAMFGAGVGMRLSGTFGVGVTGSWFSKASDAAYTLSVANPAVANKPRSLSGTAASLNHQEFVTHIQALYALPLGSKGRLVLSAGPSIFNLKQDLLQSVQFNEVPGFATITLNQLATTSVSKTMVGFNVGADITWPIARHIGVGTVTRYSSATTTVDPGSATTGLTRSVELKAGGLQLGGGLRFLF